MRLLIDINLPKAKEASLSTCFDKVSRSIRAQGTHTFFVSNVAHHPPCCECVCVCYILLWMIQGPILLVAFTLNGSEIITIELLTKDYKWSVRPHTCVGHGSSQSLVMWPNGQWQHLWPNLGKCPLPLVYFVECINFCWKKIHFDWFCKSSEHTTNLVSIFRGHFKGITFSCL